MKDSKYNWQMPAETQPDEAFEASCKELNLSPLLAKLLWQRGIQTNEQLQGFLQPQLTDLHDPYLFYDMEKVVNRLHEAIANGERILVYGDYDADGITSTTIMVETIELLGGDVTYYLPNRFTDGYGPNQSVYEAKINEGIQLIVTVDNGVSGHEAIAYANSQNVDVIVTDHHELPQELPDAYGIIHPRHPQGSYPFGELAGVGVAFKVACALLDEVPTEFLDLVAIGTVADMVSLTDENRVLVKFGLEIIKQTERIGLQELMSVAGVKAATFDEQNIGFAISPRLNAIGRLGDPNPAVRLMTTFDEEEAKSLAKDLNEINDQRKNLVETITEAAMQQVDPNSKVNLVAGTGWHEGVLGIVAGRLLQATGKPTLALTIKPDGLAKGSGRSVDALNLFKMLDSFRDLFTSFGGHHAAVGLSLPEEKLPELQAKIDQYLTDNQIELQLGGTLSLDEQVHVSEVSVAFINSLKALAPFGMDNPLPQFLFSGVTCSNLNQIGANQSHLKFVVNEEGAQMDAIGFGFGPDLAELNHSTVDLVGELSINEWNGNKKAQLMLKDFAVGELQIFDLRGKKNRRQLAPLKDGRVVAFGNKISKELQQIFPSEQIVFYQTIDQTLTEINANDARELLFIDCPLDPQIVQELVQKSEAKRVSLVLDANDDAYLDGLGTREQYARLFKFVQSQEQVDVRYKLSMVANYLKIPQKLLIFMIQVFFELEFVTINDGVLRKGDIGSKRQLAESKTYQERQAKIKSEEFLLLSDINQLKNWLLG